MIRIDARQKFIPISFLILFMLLLPVDAFGQLRKMSILAGDPISSGIFLPKVDFPTGDSPCGVFVCDFDGDGKPDMISTNQNSNTISVFHNLGAGRSIASNSFADKVDYEAGANPTYAAIGDLDGDGKPDLVITNYHGNTISVFRNTSTIGHISFEAKVDFGVGNYPMGIGIGDLDGDGKPDLVVVNRNSNTISIFRNTCSVGTINSSSFAPSINFPTGSYPVQVAIGDLDGDGKLDLAVTNSNSNSVSVYRNKSSIGEITVSSFAAKIDFATGQYPIGVALGDLDEDGKLDIVTENFYGNSVSILQSTSTIGAIVSNSFLSKVDLAAGNGPYYVSIADLNGDGKPDIVVANKTDNTISLFQNVSSIGSITNTSFGVKVDLATGVNPITVVSADLNGDGQPDLAVANEASNSLSVFQNIGNLPSPPQDLIAISGGGNVQLKWNRSVDQKFLRYRIYSGTSSPAFAKIDSSTDNANDTTRLISGLTNNMRYYFNVTTVDSFGKESVPSNEVSAIPILPFQILTIKDVPNDQGKSVSIIWKTFETDSVRPFVVSSYNIWRRDTATIWTHIWQLPARSDSLLFVVVPTLFDSTKTNGMHWSVFQVTAHGTDPAQIAYSIVDSGYSIDNLAPNAPTGTQARISGDDVVLRWDRSKDPDFRYFAIYRSSVSGQFPQGLQPYKTTTDTTFADVGAAIGKTFYRISAVDFSGNESGLSPGFTALTEGVDNTDAMPKEYMLYANYPNPFNPSTTIRFGLPERSKVKLAILDTLGKIVAILCDGELDAGYQDVPWRASVASGIYFCRFEAVSLANPSKRFVDVKKMVFLK
jgi:hypothetical protein